MQIFGVYLATMLTAIETKISQDIEVVMELTEKVLKN